MTPGQKWLLGGGVAAAALGIGYLLIRKRKPTVDLGWGVVSYTKDFVTANARAVQQGALAEAGSRLKNWREADGASVMVNASSTNAEAYAKAAYWLAVASRILGDRSLAHQAYLFGVKGSATYAIPGSSFMTGNIEQISADAQAKLPTNTTNREIKSIAVILGRHASTEVVDARKAQKKGVVHNAFDAAKQTVKDPLGLDKEKATWKKWAWGVGLSAAALLALRFAFSREYHAVGELFKKGEPKQIEAKSE